MLDGGLDREGGPLFGLDLDLSGPLQFYRRVERDRRLEGPRRDRVRLGRRGVFGTGEDSGTEKRE